MQKKIIIAIDGYSSCGKSTLAKDLAVRLGYRYIDSGAMYRAVTYYFTQNNIDTANVSAVTSALTHIHIDFEYDSHTGKQITLLNGTSVETEIRTPSISDQVSQVSTIKEVRDFLVAQQKALGTTGGIIMDGRDIGTAVFPNAELKLFMTADDQIRAQRRYDELKAKGVEITLEEVLENNKQRDYIDSTRKESPLRKADDAITLDNSNITPEQQLEMVVEMVRNLTNDKVAV